MHFYITICGRIHTTLTHSSYAGNVAQWQRAAVVHVSEVAKQCSTPGLTS